MLVYIRDSQLPTVLQEVTKNEIPSELADRLAEEKKIELVSFFLEKFTPKMNVHF